MPKLLILLTWALFAGPLVALSVAIDGLLEGVKAWIDGICLIWRQG